MEDRLYSPLTFRKETIMGLSRGILLGAGDRIDKLIAIVKDTMCRVARNDTSNVE
jgi:hypothetical protein